MTHHAAQISAIVLGGTGYVAGELLRLIAGHPRLQLAAILSDSQSGSLVSDAFPHLFSVYPTLQFASLEAVESVLRAQAACAIFSAAPHGVSASRVDHLLNIAEQSNIRAHCVDISADFRYRSTAAYEAVYHHPHAAPGRIASFTCALPEHLPLSPTPHIAHPGCFATAILLASVPLLALKLTDARFFISGITGSTGSGRKPTDSTHHPLRHSDLYSYNVLTHRHVPEIIACAKAATGTDAEFNFAPHSGPFSRGIHVTVMATLKNAMSSADVQRAFNNYYRECFFVKVGGAAPRIKDVVSSNFAHLSATTDKNSIAVTAVIDNLTKGAAGGAVQWMNRLFDLPEHSGLTATAPGWT